MLFILCVISLGIFLRLYLFDSQILGGDEWHAIRQAAEHSYSHILTHFNQSDNCIPLTVFYKFLLQTGSLSEWGVHSSQIISGILLLIIFPLILISLFKARVIAVFLILLVVSPLLIYYSRFGRPYIMVALLSFISVFAFYFWVKTMKKRFAGVYCMTAILSPYFSLFSFPAVAAPLVFTFIFKLIDKAKAHKAFIHSLPDFKHLFLLGFIIIAGIAVWFLPTFQSLSAITPKVGQGSIDLHTIEGLLILFSGSFNLFLSGLLGGFFIYGLFTGLKKDRFLFGLFLSVILCQLLSIIIIRPAMIQSPLVFVRYSISCLSLWLLVIAIGLDDFHSRIKSLFGINERKLSPVLKIFMFLFFASIVFTNPVIRVYLTRSNFTNHNDFINPSRRDLVALYKNQLDLIPKFYLELKEETNNTQIIEMPPMIPWAHIDYHLYQKIHRKNVKLGYSREILDSYSTPLADRRLDFKNLFNIDDTESLINSGFNYVVIHHDIIKETLRVRKSLNMDFTIKSDEVWARIKNSFARKRPRREARIIIRELESVFGSPYFEDEWITVFEIS